MANGSRHSLFFVEEPTYGVVPSNPILKHVRISGTTLGLSKDSLQSEEIRSDRQIADFRLGANQVGGDINFELSYGSFDELLKASLVSNDWTTAVDSGDITIDVTATNKFEIMGSDSPATIGISEGDTIITTGFSDNENNTTSFILSISGDVVTISKTVLTVASGSGAEKIVVLSNIKAGATRSSFTLVRHFSDVATSDDPYYIYKGVEITSLDLTVSANSMITGAITVVGQNQETVQDLTEFGSYTIADNSVTPPLDSFTGTLMEGDVPVAVVTEITLKLENSIEPRFVVGDKNSIHPSIGRSNLTGQITAYFEDSRLVNKFLSESESSLVFSLPDGFGNVQNYRVPRIKYTGGQPDVSGEGPITLSMPFQALLDSVTGTNIIIERSPA